MGPARSGPPLDSHGMSRFRTTLIALVVVLAACSSAPSDAMRGIVVDVVGDLDTVESFTVLVDGERVEFTPAADGEFAFPLGHLRDHLRSGEPVVVGWELVDDEFVATFVDDG